MARELLERTGDFYPFAGGLSPTGEVKLIAGAAGKSSATTNDTIEFIALGLAGGVRDGDYVATGICFASTDPEIGEAICIEFEDADEPADAVIVPFVRRKKLIEFSDMVLRDCKGRVFSRNEKRIQP